MGVVKTLMITIIVASALFLGIGSFMDSFYQYNPISEEYNSLTDLGVSEEAERQTKELQEKITERTDNPLAFVDILATGVFSTLNLMFAVPNMAETMVTAGAGATPIIPMPEWFIAILITIVALLIVFAVIKALIKVEV